MKIWLVVRMKVMLYLSLIFFFNHECEYMVGYDMNGVIGMFYFYLLNQWNEIMVGCNGI